MKCRGSRGFGPTQAHCRTETLVSVEEVDVSIAMHPTIARGGGRLCW
jgi:hypothetical protein